MIWLYGKHACFAAIQNNNRTIHSILVTNKDDAEEIKHLSDKKLNIRIQTKKELDQVLGRDAVHQGIAMQVSPLSYEDLSYLQTLDDTNQIVVILDQVTDPHNVGAIMRSCAAFGAKAIIEQERHSPKETGTLAKAASGALEILPRIHVGNIAQTLKQLQSMGFWTAGFSEQGNTYLPKADLKGKVALVMGSEGDGMRRLTKEYCDFHLKLPTAEFSTLNVSTATAVALYQVYIQHHEGRLS
ncbi:MAG: 23S rRNA (guanosine(2251)-2'-O)-methyltransferase RlmB [Alphaproteobacteria bacterium]|nr:23S rRNA (guanosine(2251)-2'-O)-methyltransferase RlmB [Alphaproteobacteria bacterium]